MTNKTVIAFEDVTVAYKNGLKAVENVSFAIREGEFVSLIGPSGCGKSTIANAAATILAPAVAEIRGTIEVTAKSMGYVSQRDSLLPWRTIGRNVETGLEIRGHPKATRKAIAKDLLSKVSLSECVDFFPYQLSGGMRQRAALARCLAYDPDVILMDEPFGALDAQARVVMQEEFLQICSERRKTFLLITHDIAEAITMSDRIILLSHRPARICSEYAVDLQDRTDPLALRTNAHFLEIQTDIWKRLSEEVRKQNAK